MEDEKFNKDLDELFRLFKKLVETQSLDDVPGVDGMMLKQFQFFFSNYENMKDQIGDQLKGQFGEPVKQMVSDLVKQLREQLGDDEFTVIEEEPVIEIDTKELSMEDIDLMLGNPDLTEDQINDLLDKRANLL
ncbi:MAG: hypothetical protein HN336_06570 [Lentimicrobiaceae bacterium]|jgi:hypothetical protein|nr:hypothetical protein [Lentimicrobiaceae bacterium]MCP4909360.1 hypothetical protein [Bacteroidota bacterium]MBT3455215.1 hypothetical protein [Lentimicrobiaceae bacterium]MBT3818625.1 hypothetical protein [Lentimicrobiaceae bacterium]MBT4061390.1 hypothetical protein [Lentimicrobiaceae bacterium]